MKTAIRTKKLAYKVWFQNKAPPPLAGFTIYCGAKVRNSSGKTPARLCIVTTPVNWIGSHSRANEDVTIINSRINHFCFVDDFVLNSSYKQSLHQTLDQFSATYDQPGMKISSKKTEVFCRSRNPTPSPRKLQVNGEILQQFETFKYQMVVTSDERQNKEHWHEDQ